MHVSAPTVETVHVARHLKSEAHLSMREMGSVILEDGASS
jgi:hypothetical protein